MTTSKKTKNKKQKEQVTLPYFDGFVNTPIPTPS